VDASLGADAWLSSAPTMELPVGASLGAEGRTAASGLSLTRLDDRVPHPPRMQLPIANTIHAGQTAGRNRNLLPPHGVCAARTDDGLPSAKQTRGYPEKGPLRIPFLLAMQGDGDASQRLVGLLVWRSGRRFRRTRYPDPSVGDRHAVTLEVVAPADITNVPLDGRGFLIDGRVGRIHIRIGVIVGVGIKRVCERCCHEDPAEEGGRETAVVEAVVVKPVV